MRGMSAESQRLEIVTDVPERAMVVFAHPDDAEIGAGGVVAGWIEAGCEVTYVLCTNGDAGTAERSLRPAELAARRAEEQRAAADFMRVKHVVMLGYPDGGHARVPRRGGVRHPAVPAAHGFCARSLPHPELPAP